MLKHLPAGQETWVWSLGEEDPLEKEMATHSSTPTWKISWMQEPGRLQSMGLQRVGYNWATSLVHWQGRLLLCLSPGKKTRVVAISSSRGIFLTLGLNLVSCISRWIFKGWVTREAMFRGRQVIEKLLASLAGLMHPHGEEKWGFEPVFHPQSPYF